MTHPITPVKLGGWEHLCERGKRERERRRQKKRGGEEEEEGEEEMVGRGREAEGSRIRREVRHKLIGQTAFNHK